MRIQYGNIIHDIAKALNLSTSTITNALNDSGTVPKKTRSEIERVAGALGYKTKNLSGEPFGTYLLGSLVTHINSTIASCVLSGAEMTAAELGYSLIFHQSMNKPDLRNVKSIFDFRRQFQEQVFN
jgi:LacI family transcriptional regulator